MGVSEGGTKITGGSGLTFEYVDNTLKRNGLALADSVSSMKAEKSGNESINIIIKSNSSQTQTKTYQTTIYFRR
ncbi:MAG: hypothetical protein U5K84_11280 [Alkalibacterium sp.]|nr:hypothetical protein [Alkalibacterium sp.]